MSPTPRQTWYVSWLISRYGLNQVFLLQDIVAWRQSVWDRYILSEAEQRFVRVGLKLLIIGALAW